MSPFITRSNRLALCTRRKFLPLTCLYLDHNPCAAEPRYANYLRDFFPLLEQLDANYAPARGAAASGIS